MAHHVLPEDSPPLFTTAQLAELLDLSVATLRSYRHRGKGPRYFMAPDSNRVLYTAADVDTWLSAAYKEQISA